MEQFIETIKQFPILWNTDSKDYHNVNKKDAIWCGIVEEINNPDIPDVKTAKNEWKKLRDGHRESIKRMKASTDPGSSAKNNWKYAEILEFILPYMKNRKRTNPYLTSTSMEITDPLEENPQEENNDDSSWSSEQIKRKKKKVPGTSYELLQEIDPSFIQRCQSKAKETDDSSTRHPLNLFFDSMCESTKKLPDCIQREVKKKIFEVVCEAEENYESYLSRQQYQYGYASSSD